MESDILPRFHDIRDASKAAFLDAYAITDSVTRAAVAAGVSRRVHYQWLGDADYFEAFEAAKEIAAEVLEAEARRRAVEGLRKYKFHDGKPVLHPETGEPYYELEYSDTLLIFKLKGALPEKYADRLKLLRDELARSPESALDQIIEAGSKAESGDASFGERGEGAADHNPPNDNPLG